MTDILKYNLSQVLQHQADILQPILAQFSHIKVNHLNYYYANWQQQILTFVGTEAGWLQYCIEQRLLDELQPRLVPLINIWDADSHWYQAYQYYRQQQHLSPIFFKTDVCLEGQHGLHLVEIGHERPLTLYEINSFFECIGQLKDESKRLQQQYPDLIMPLNKPLAVPEPPEPPTTCFFDLDQIEEANPIELNSTEKKALILRIQGHSDDEIAQQMQLYLTDVRQLFSNIADKHHHPYIPTSVYKQYLPDAMQFNQSNAHFHK